MKLYSVLFCIYIIQLQSKYGVSSENEACKISKNLETQCGSYAYTIVRPLLDFINQMRDEMSKSESKDLEIRELRAKIDPFQELIDAYKKNIQDLNAQVKDLHESLNFCRKNTITKESISETVKDLQTKLENLNINTNRILEEKENSKKELENCSLPSSCVPFPDSSDSHRIAVPGIDPFFVQCDSKITGTGWTVIQQRIDGKINFNRDWVAYRNGFGTFDGDFFLGLEKIYRLTSFHRHELYIYMEKFNGSTVYSHYDNFKIDGEKDDFRLTSLGVCSGTAIWDSMRNHEGKKFTTFDKDNDEWADGNCALFSNSGWWHSHCVNSNLNGKYFDQEVKSEQSIYWEDKIALKKVKMLIRPRGN